MKIFLICTSIIMMLWSHIVVASEHPSIDGKFTLTRVATEQWSAQWCFSKQVDKLIFGPVVGTYRTSSWDLDDTNFVLGSHEGEEAIARIDGKNFSCVEARIRPYEFISEKEYVSFSRFSTGGMTVFTGHMIPWVMIDGTPYLVNFEENFVALGGEITLAASSNIDNRRFVYFGPDDQVKSSGSVSIIDKNVPDWLQNLLGETLNSIQTIFTRDLKYTPDDPYVFFIGAGHLNDLEGYSIKGGALDNQVQFTLRGKDILNKKDWTSKDFPRLVAHEIVHTFQSKTWLINGGHLPWLTEGGSDALAFDILQKSKIWDNDFYLKYKKSIFGRCTKGGSGFAIKTVHELGRYDLAYSCGAVVNWLAADLVRKYQPSATSIDIWATMARDEKGASVNYEKIFIEALMKLGLSDKDRKNLLSFIETKHPDMEKSINNFMIENDL